MLRLAKAFWDLALWRITPAELPASRFLLALSGAALALVEAVGVLLPPSQSDRIVERVAFRVLLPLGFCWLVLAFMTRRERFMQSASAFLGVTALALVPLYLLSMLVGAVGGDRPEALPIALLSLAALIWWLLACAHIFRAALNSGLALGLALAVGYFSLESLLQHLLKLDT